MFETVEKQVQDFQGEGSDVFCKKALAYLKKFYPNEVSLVEARGDLLTWVSGVVGVSHEYGLKAEAEVYSFLRAAVIFGENFYELPWAQEIFEWRMDSDVKAALLDSELTKQLENAFENLKQQNEQLAKQKITQFCNNKQEYVYNFNNFYGLNLQNIQEAYLWLLEVCSKAYEFGIIEERYLDAYLEVAMHFGKDFYERSWAKEILSIGKTAQEKIAALQAFLNDNFGNVDA